MKYGFYSKNDDSKEIIMTQDFVNIIQATEFFSKIKALPIDTFLELYNVTQITKNEPYR